MLAVKDDGRSSLTVLAVKQRASSSGCVLPVFEYETKEHLSANLDQKVLGPAEAKVLELRGPQPG